MLALLAMKRVGLRVCCLCVLPVWHGTRCWPFAVLRLEPILLPDIICSNAQLVLREASADFGG
jgi:hypothetical protein